MAMRSFPIDDVRAMIGNGIAKLVERAFAARGVALAGDGLARMTERMMDVYGRHLVEQTVLMPGAGEIVTAYSDCRRQDRRRHQQAGGILARHSRSELGLALAGRYRRWRRYRPGAQAGARHAVAMRSTCLGVAAHRALLVGDSPADIGAAKAVPMACVAVRGGYTTVPADELGAGAVIDTLSQLPQAIEALKEPA